MVGPSPASGSSCATCLRKFSVHFRRPYKVGEKPRLNPNSYILKYNGEYGFDWLRDEYIYALTETGISNVKNTILKQSNDPRVIQNLKLNYTSGVNKIVVFGTEYIPAHLAIFATNVKKADPNASTTINRDGALLSIEIHQLAGDDSTPLPSNDGTELIFETTDPVIKISTKTGKEKQNKVIIPLSIFIKKQSIRDLGRSVNPRKFYLTEDILKITCEEATTKGGAVIVKARKIGNPKEEVVGILHVAANNIVPKARICLVNLRVNKNPVYQPIGLEYRLKYQGFNQALVRAEVVKSDDFDIGDLYLKYKSKDLGDFLDKYFNNARVPNDINSVVHYDLGEDFKRDVCKLYEKYRKINLINSDNTKETYVFFSNIRFEKPSNSVGTVSRLLGSAVRGREVGSGSTVKWGNSVILTRDGSTDLETVVHEILHSFGVTHVFDKDANNNRDFSFHKGFTDNFMDYQDTDHKGKSKFAFEPAHNTIKKSTPSNQNSLLRCQWIMLRKDRSVH
ncbi:hypothetical protein [Acinetobacter wuhouensis]|nr:hypothetical protein [Acinetobacter wuhouensis]